jgi:hypothetical protein
MKFCAFFCFLLLVVVAHATSKFDEALTYCSVHYNLKTDLVHCIHKRFAVSQQCSTCFTNSQHVSGIATCKNICESNSKLASLANVETVADQINNLKQQLLEQEQFVRKAFDIAKQASAATPHILSRINDLAAKLATTREQTSKLSFELQKTVAQLSQEMTSLIKQTLLLAPDKFAEISKQLTNLTSIVREVFTKLHNTETSMNKILDIVQKNIDLVPVVMKHITGSQDKILEKLAEMTAQVNQLSLFQQNQEMSRAQVKQVEKLNNQIYWEATFTALAISIIISTASYIYMQNTFKRQTFNK